MSSARHDPDIPSLQAVVQALVFASDSPISASEIAEVLGNVGEEDVLEAVAQLETSLDNPDSGLRIEQVAGGYRFTTRRNVGDSVRRLYRFRNRRRLSPASLETLAIVAYRQPITAPEIQQLRGVDPQGVLNSLLQRRLVRILGKKKVVGRPLLYGTTREFLMHFGLNSLEDLPSLDAFGDVLGAGEEDRLFASGPATSPEEVEPLETSEPAEDDGKEGALTGVEPPADPASSLTEADDLPGDDLREDP